MPRTRLAGLLKQCNSFLEIFILRKNLVKYPEFKGRAEAIGIRRLADVASSY